MSRRCFVIAVTIMIFAPLIFVSAEPVPPSSPSLHSSSGELNDALFESRFISRLDGDQAARKRT